MSTNDIQQEFDSNYGLNATLINGLKYFPQCSNAIGNEYWNDCEALTGEICLNGKWFINQHYGIDINRQTIVLTYKNKSGFENKIVLNNLAIDSLRFLGNYWIYADSLPIREKWLQIVYSGDMSCYMGYYKELKFVDNGNQSAQKYSPTSIKKYVVFKNQVKSVKNNRQLINLFPDKLQPELKKWMSQNNINIRNNSIEQLRSVFNFGNQLLKLQK